MLNVGEVSAFVAVILDCLTEQAKAFRQHWGFEELPSNPYRLFISVTQLDRDDDGSRSLSLLTEVDWGPTWVNLQLA